MSYNYRSTSPGRRAIYDQQYARSSDRGLVQDLVSPRASADRVVPVPIPAGARDGRGGDRVYESRTRPRRSTFGDSQIPVIEAGSASRSKGAGETSSPAIRGSEDVPKGSTKILYAVGGSQTHLVEQSVDSSGRRSHTRQASLDKARDARKRSSRDTPGFTTTGGAKGGKEYHLTGALPRDATSMYSYTDPRGMFEETEPVWRARKGSADGKSARPQSMMFDTGPRSSQRDLGPPTSKALDRYNEGISRSNSTRHAARPSQRPEYDDPGYASNDEYRGPRRTSTLPAAMPQEYDYGVSSPRVAHHSGRPVTVLHERQPAYADYYSVPPPAPRDSFIQSPYDARSAPDYRVDDRRDSRTADRTSGRDYKDADLERRGFGIMPLTHAGPGAEDFQDDYNLRSPLPPAGTVHNTAAYAPRPSRAELQYQHPDELEAHDRLKALEKELKEAKDRRRRERDPRDKRDDYDDEYDELPAREARRSRDDRDSDRERIVYREKDRVREKEKDRDRDRGYDRDRDRDPDYRHEAPRREKDSLGSGVADIVPAVMLGTAGVAAISAYDRKSKQSKPSRDRDDSEEDDYREDRAYEPRPSRRTADIPEEKAPQDKRRPSPEDVMIVTDAAGLAEPRVQQVPLQPPPVQPKPVGSADEEFLRRLEQARLQQAKAEKRPSKEVLPETVREMPPSRPVPSFADERLPDRAAESVQQPRHSRRSPPPAEDLAEHIPRDGRGRSGTDERLRLSSSAEDMGDSDKRRQVRIVEPPAENEARPKGILKKPKQQFPEDPNPIREGVAPLKDKKLSRSIPPNARWTKVSRNIINVEALEELGERFEERQDCLIVLRVLDDSDVQKMANLTAYIRQQRERYHDRDEAREARRRARQELDEYSDGSGSDEFDPDRKKPPRMLESGAAVPSAAASLGLGTGGMPGGFPQPVEHRERERDRERERERDGDRDRRERER